jgi:AcrR family transcriptional regulator
VSGAQAPTGARQRLMVALAEVMGEKGYANATIADIVAAARMSKRTFYEHFADKEECLLAMYAHACDQLVDVLRAAGTVEGLPWRERVRATAYSYLAAIDAMPTISRALLVEVQAAGARAFALRRRMQERFADVLRELVEQGRAGEPEVRPLSPALALAIVGGINELLLHAVDPYGDDPPDRWRAAGSAASVTGLTEAVTDLVSAVLAYQGPADPTAR